MDTRQIAKAISDCEKHYSNDDFKGGLRIATNAIRHFPKCGELLAWNAVFLEKTKQHEQALSTSKKAIMMDINNSHVWKLNADVLREQGQYLQSLQSLTMAHNKDPKDDSVLRELCSLHIHFQHYKQFLSTARELLSIQSQDSNMCRVILGLALCEEYDEAERYLEAFEPRLLPPTREEDRLFRNELSLFRSLVLLRGGHYDECLMYLDKQQTITDHVSVLEFQAKCYSAKNEKEKLIEKVRELLNNYPDNGDYFQLIEEKMTREEYIQELLRAKEEIHSSYAHVRILEIVDMSNELFDKLLIEHVNKLLKKGSPALYATLADLSPEKMFHTIEVVKSLELPIYSFPVRQVFIAQALLSLKKYDEALVEIEKGISHTPTIVELYVTKCQILSKMGRNSEALEVAKTLSVLDPADRNSNNTYVRQLFRNGYAKEARIAAEPFSINQKKKPQLFKTEFNKVHFRAAHCSLRGGDVENALHFYQDVKSHFEEYKNGMYSYFAWGVRRPHSIFEMIEWEQTLVNKNQHAKAYANIAKIMIQRGQLKELRKESINIVNTKNELACAYICVNFALLKEPILALKAFLKIKGSLRFTVSPAMKIAAEAANNIEGVAKELFFELYKPLDNEPSTYEDLLCYSRGLLYTNKRDEAKNALLKAASLVDEYKFAVDIFLTAKIEMADEALAKEVLAKIHEKYPWYEIEFKNGYSEDEPHEHSIKREK